MDNRSELIGCLGNLTRSILLILLTMGMIYVYAYAIKIACYIFLVTLPDQLILLTVVAAHILQTIWMAPQDMQALMKKPLWQQFKNSMWSVVYIVFILSISLLLSSSLPQASVPF